MIQLLTHNNFRRSGPLACWRLLPVRRPMVFLALPLAVSALCAIFLVIVM